MKSLITSSNDRFVYEQWLIVTGIAWLESLLFLLEVNISRGSMAWFRTWWLILVSVAYLTWYLRSVQGGQLGLFGLIASDFVLDYCLKWFSMVQKSLWSRCNTVMYKRVELGIICTTSGITCNTFFSYPVARS